MFSTGEVCPVRVKFLPRFRPKWVRTLANSAGLAVLVLAVCAPSTAQSDGQAAAPKSPAEVVRELIRETQARQAAQRAEAAGEPQPQPPPPDATSVVSVVPPPDPVVAAPAPKTVPAPTPAPAPAPLPAAVNATLKPASVTTPNQPPAAVKSVQVIHDKNGSAIEILTSRPVPPALQTLPTPPRLVIDLPNANVAVKQKKLKAKGEEFTAIRVDQYQVTPPVTRVVVDLQTAREYTWDAAGNRLTVRLKPAEEPKPKAASPAQPLTVPSFTAGVQPSVVPVSPRPTGSLVTAGSRIGSGSSVTAASETAILHIARGGEVHVCPGSTVSVTASKSGQELMLGMSTGALETHYQLGPSSDSVLTPDFRILLAGPGDFDYAISSNSRGDTCVRALLGNTASVIVSELMGDRSYQVKPTEQVVFHNGKIDTLSNDVPLDCGCPPAPQPVLRASVPPSATPVSDANLPANVHLPSSSAPSSPTLAALDPMLPPLPNATRSSPNARPAGEQVNLASANPGSTALPHSKPTDIHVQLETPFVFRATGPPPAAARTAQNNLPPMPADSQPKQDPPPASAQTPASDTAASAAKQPQHKGFFGKIRGLFSSVFK